MPIVMELCAGGELFDRIIARGHYIERAAASVLRVIMDVVNVCNCKGVMYRDLKPENFLFTSWDENALLKATDFGLSVFFEEGKFLFLPCILFVFRFYVVVSLANILFVFRFYVVVSHASRA